MNLFIDFISHNWLALTAGLVNFIWIYLEYKASIWLWPVGIILPLFYIALSWQALFLGNILVNLYFLVTSIIGWIMWLRHKSSTQEASEAQGITRARGRDLVLHLAILALLYYPIFLLLKEGNSSLPVCDTIATLFSFLGMLYLSRKQLEHWLCWIVANSLSMLIFFHSRDYISAFIFSVNLLVSILGYIRWRAEMQAQSKPSSI